MTTATGDAAVVRAARTGDAETVVDFNLAMARETEAKELVREVVARGVERALEDPDRGRYLVAERAGEIAGCLLVTREWSDWRDGWFWWIQSVYVAPAHRGRGIYPQLHEFLRREARAAGDVIGIRLYVEKENRRAQQTYQKLGMSQTNYLLFEEAPLGSADV